MRRMMMLMVTACAAAAWADAPRARAAGEVRTKLLKEACCDFAFNPQTGDLLGVNPVTNRVMLYPKAYLDGKSAEVVGPVTVGELPVAAVFKRCGEKSYYAVVCQRDSKMYLLEAATLKRTKAVELSGQEASSPATATDPTDPYVYYTYGRGHGSKAGRVNVATMTDEGPLALTGSWDQMMDVAVSGDGKLLYGRGPWSPSGFKAFRAARRGPDGPTQWVNVHYDHHSAAMYVPDPFGRYTAAGRVLYSADLKTKVAELKFIPLCFFRNRPVIAGVAGLGWQFHDDDAQARLVAASYNTFQPYGKLALPEKFGKTEGLKMPGVQNPAADFKRFGFELRLFADDAGQRVIAAHGLTVVLAPLASLQVPDEPFLLVEADAPEQALVGRALTIRLKPRDERISVALAAGPKGMTLKGRTLTWTPTDADIGDAAVELKLSHKDKTRTQVIRLNVVRPNVRLAFAPAELWVGPDGARAVAWSAAGSDPMDPFHRDQAPAARARVALLDLEAMKVVSSKTLLQQVSAAAADEHFVYVAALRADRFDALSPKDLSQKRRIHTGGRVEAFISVPPKLLLAIAADGSVTAYSTPDLKRVRLPVLEAQSDQPVRVDPRAIPWMHRRYSRQGGPAELVRLPAGWCTGGVLTDPSMTKVRALLSVAGLPKLPVQTARPPVGPVPWGRLLQGGQLRTASGQLLGQMGGTDGGYRQQRALILPAHPVAAVLKIGMDADYARQARLDAKLLLHELTGARLIRTVPLASQAVSPEQARGGAYGDGRGGPLLHAAGRKLVALLGDRVYCHTIGEATLKLCPTPFQFKLPERIAVADAKGKMQISHGVTGGRKPLEFELTASAEGIAIDKATGTVTLDGPALMKQALAELAEGLAPHLRGLAEGEPAAPTAVMALFAGPLKARYKALTGREPEGLPVLVPIGLIASDADQQVASLNYQAVLMVPEAAVKAIVTQAAREVEKRRAEEALRRAEAERQWRERRAAATRPAVGDDAGRLRRLEKRVEALEAKLEVLMELLRKKQP